MMNYRPRDPGPVVPAGGERRQPRRRAVQVTNFAMCVLLVGLTWGLVLPSIAKRPAMQQRIRWLDAQGIDPSAMYYTDLEVMDKILRRRDKPRGTATGD